MNYPKNSGKINLFLKNYFDFQQVINDRYDQCEGKTYTIQSNRKWTREQLTWQWGNEVGFVDFVKTQQNDDRVRIIKVEEKNEGEKKRRKDEKKTRKRREKESEDWRRGFEAWPYEQPVWLESNVGRSTLKSVKSFLFF